MSTSDADAENDSAIADDVEVRRRLVSKYLALGRWSIVWMVCFFGASAFAYYAFIGNGAMGTKYGALVAVLAGISLWYWSIAKACGLAEIEILSLRSTKAWLVLLGLLLLLGIGLVIGLFYIPGSENLTAIWLVGLTIFGLAFLFVTLFSFKANYEATRSAALTVSLTLLQITLFSIIWLVLFLIVLSRTGRR